MTDNNADALTLSQSHGWTATPWNYNSLRFLRLPPDRNAELIYGYGQSIYAKIECEWAITAPNILRFTYLASAPYQRFQGYVPAEDNAEKNIEYMLTHGEVNGIENIIGKPYKFLWTLELSQSPWPDDLNLPYEIPRIFYGHLQ